MIDLRQRFNEQFTEEKYQAYLQDLETDFGIKIDFRVAETPVFVPRKLKHRLIQACNDIIKVITAPDYVAKTAGAVPPQCLVPNEDAHTQFLAIDFAITKDADDELSPQVIELQGFPSLYGFQDHAARKARQHYDIPADRVGHLFSGLDDASYMDLLRRTILGSHQPEEVVLLEIEPHKQKTRIDFYVTQRYLGVRPLCLSEVIKEGRQLFYMTEDGQKQRIKRIYNRIIFDELVQRPDLPRQFELTDDVDVEWAGHPNWFFRISKYTLPFLDSPYVPKTWFLDQLPAIPADLENYVLKPLFSFAGAGVIVDVSRADIDAIPADQRHNYILMRKVAYAPVVPSPDEPVKVEIRMLYLWPETDAQPTLATSLVRLSKGKMIGVNYNKDKTWVGGTVAFFEHD